MSEAQMYQQIRRFWKRNRNQYQKLQNFSIRRSKNEPIYIMCGNDKIMLPRLDENGIKHELDRAFTYQQKVSECQLLLNKFKVTNEKKD